MFEEQRGSVFVSWGYCNQVLQTRCLKTIGIYGPTILEASLKSRCWQDQTPSDIWREFILASSQFLEIWLAVLGISLLLSEKKKKVQCESRELSFLGAKLGLALGDSISDGSEKLLPRRKQESSVLRVILVKGVHIIKHTSLPEACCSSQGADVTIKDFSTLVLCPWICSGVF